MKLKSKDRKKLVEVRIQKAKETLEEVKGNIGLGYWRVAANRLYYASFYAASALLIKHEITAHTHAGVINQLSLHFVSKELSAWSKGNYTNTCLNFANQVTTTTGAILKKKTCCLLLNLWSNLLPKLKN